MLIVLALALTLSVGFIVGSNRNSKSEKITSNEPSTKSEQPAKNVSTGDVKEIISYQIPSGWKEATCADDNKSVYFITNDNPEVDCSAAPESQVKLSTGNENYTECSEIPEKQEVKKHICKSEFINDLRSLVAETEYLASSVYGRETSLKTYYIDSGSGIVKSEYIYSSDGSDQAGFESLVKSIKSK